MKIIIRPGAKSDYGFAEKVMREVQSLHVSLRPDIYKSTDSVYSVEYFNKLVSEKRILIAEKDGKPAGFLSFMYRHTEACKQVKRDVIFVDDLAVKSEFRSQGIGTALIEKIRNKVRTEGLDGLELQVNARNLSARKFYEKLGFTEKSVNLELL